MTQFSNTIKVDTCPMPPQNRIAVVFETFDQLGVGMTMELANDHDPLSLRIQFEIEKPNLFSWAYLESGPKIWRVEVTKLKGKHGMGHCCGACGG